MKIKGVILDLDGTLIDSMQLWTRAPYLYLKSIGVDIHPATGRALFAMTSREAMEYLIRRFHLSLTWRELAHGINEVVGKFYARDVQLKPGALALLQGLRDRHIPAVIGTSTDEPYVAVALEKLGLSPYIRRIITCTAIGAPKSEPPLFLEAMREMGTEPENTLLFEDGLYSIRTAKALGLGIVGVYDAISASDAPAIRAFADVFISDGEPLTNAFSIFDTFA